MKKSDWDLLLHVFLTHKSVQPFLKGKPPQFTIIHGRNRLGGNVVAKKLDRPQFYSLMMKLVDKAGRRDELDRELELLAEFLEDKK